MLAVTPITLHYLFSVNCYAIETDGAYILIDTGLSQRRSELEKALQGAGCEPGSLRLIVLTHAHTDHAGNCAYLREKYGAPIAMHAGDIGRAERGDMFWSPDGKHAFASAMARAMQFLVRIGTFDGFEPDVLLDDGQNLGEYGLNATILHFPGHTPGSIGVLTAGGDLFCGDLLTGTGAPARNSLVDDAADMDASIDTLGSLDIRMVYPGHGKPFPIELLTQDRGAGGQQVDRSG